MSKLKYLVIHCTATPEGRIVTKEDIIRWHTSPVSKGGRGWKRVGYSDFVAIDGKLINLMPYDEDDEVETWEITNGVAGMNSVCRHIVYAGGLDAGNYKPKDTRTPAQKATLEKFVKDFVTRHPDVIVCGHNNLNAGKACPSFDVPKWCKEIGLNTKNIFKK